MQVGQLGPCDGHHLAAGVELHGAGAERDHGVCEGQVPVLQALQVAEHLVLAVVGVEDGSLQELAAPLELAKGAVHLQGLAGRAEYWIVRILIPGRQWWVQLCKDRCGFNGLAIANEALKIFCASHYINCELFICT